LCILYMKGVGYTRTRLDLGQAPEPEHCVSNDDCWTVNEFVVYLID